VREWTHAALVERSAAWLRSTRKCRHWLTNTAQPDEEQPDAIGWNVAGESTVVESKISLDDFRRDKLKTWRFMSTGMGLWKFYLFPDGLMEPMEFDLYRQGRMHLSGCGLLVAKAGRLIEVVRAMPRQSRDFAAEVRLIMRHPVIREIGERRAQTNADLVMLEALRCSLGILVRNGVEQWTREDGFTIGRSVAEQIRQAIEAGEEAFGA
jgi:hypothetical protein